MRKRPNMFLPRFVYKIRREHYIYWEISRVARGLPKTFTYSNWDPKAVGACIMLTLISLAHDVSRRLGRKNGI